MGIEYTDRQKRDTQTRLFNQLIELGPIIEQPQVTCRCSEKMPIQYMYRCMECGLWFCKSCAKEHFGLEGIL